jgi:hypothetical protein
VAKHTLRLAIIFLCSLLCSVAVGGFLPMGGMATYGAHNGSERGAVASSMVPQVNGGLAKANDTASQEVLDAEPPDADTDADADADAEDSSGLRPFDKTIENFEVLAGLFTLYRNPETNQAYLGLRPDQLGQNLLLVATLESGVGEAGLFRGWPINDLLLQFRQAPGNRLHLVVPNVYFRNAYSLPRDRQLLDESFSDSLLFALDIVSIHPETGEMLLDLNDLLLNRDPADLAGQFAWVLSSYSQNPDTSYLAAIKTFPENLEIEAMLGFSGGTFTDPWMEFFAPSFTSLPDPRGFSLKVRYSLSSLPNHPAFEPREADERVGYFITAYRAPREARDPFVRSIYRWHLQKQDPNAALSPPVSPVVFWIENAMPPPYRQAIREGIELWNQAFERAGFLNAIEVRQMPDNADWDPADVRYNVIRWSDSFGSSVLGLGPSRVNPLTGEILDADVILDASVISWLNRQYDHYVSQLTPTGETALMQFCGYPMRTAYLQGWRPGEAAGSPANRSTTLGQPPLADRSSYCAGVQGSQQMAFAAMALDVLGDPFETDAEKTAFINGYLKALTAHEVGHVLGLRHNFLGSAMLSPEEINDPAITQSRGMLSSVMDYFPPHLAPQGEPQGDYFPTRLGVYDMWAIEYGYKPTTSPATAHRELQRIAARSSETTDLDYATDEDIFDFIDPKADVWDLSSDPLHYAQGQLGNARAVLDQLDWFSLDPGEGYGNLRRRVNLVFNYYQHQAMIIANYIGGQRFIRTDPWSSRGRAPFEPVPAEEQRAALATLGREVFAADTLQLPPELLNRLAPDQWWHWGESPEFYPLDYPIYDRILFLQSFVLSDVLYGERLVRLRDNELRTTSDNPITLAEVFETLHQSIWAEILQDDAAATGISSVRRGLQRHHLNLLSNLALNAGYDQLEMANTIFDVLAVGPTLSAPTDARVLARYQLKQLQDSVSRYLRRGGNQTDLSTLSHLQDVQDRLEKILNAPLRSR